MVINITPMDQINKPFLNPHYWASTCLSFNVSIHGFIVSSLLSGIRLLTDDKS